MRPGSRRSGFTLFQLLLIVAIVVIMLGLYTAATGGIQQRATQVNATNNLKILMLAVHNYHDTNGNMPPGVDANQFSATAKLLPYIEQDAVSKRIDFKQSIDDKANAALRAIRIKTLESPLDPQGPPRKEYGPTNYLYNDKVFFLNSKTSLVAIADGTSNTVGIGETLKGDGKPQAEDVKRQHILLGKADLKGLTPDAGVKHWKADKNVAADRCASWMDGRFLQGTFNGQLKLNDERPDVSCAGLGGVSALRSLEQLVNVGLADGSVRTVSIAVSQTTWQAALTPNGGEVLGSDW